MTHNDDVQAAKERGIEQFDFQLGMSFDIGPEDIDDLATGLGEAEAFDADSADRETLAEYAAALKRLADASEDARKDVFESALSERTEDGETVGPVRKLSGRNTWVNDTEGAFAAVAEAGSDPLDVAKVSISDLRDVLGDEADTFIGESSYEYFRRVD